ncbi:hypothetical protein AVEN_274952-1 [Araneus ventricosus]|uniref:Uncharacterized protein n=1 Tax=Araneus ventricosus TaxID=182803 RepID=A0A4Y2QIU7_ARAVE|nr:hypothetical protein AVEN_274952-1 [Araneus ventricosus]
MSVYMEQIQLPNLEEGGGLIPAGKSSKSSDMLYSNVSPSDAEEELISKLASDSRDCKILFTNGGRTAIVKSDEAEAFSLNEATDGKEGIDRLVIAGGALGVEADCLEIESAEISGLVWVDGAFDFFTAET